MVGRTDARAGQERARRRRPVEIGDKGPAAHDCDETQRALVGVGEGEDGKDPVAVRDVDEMARGLCVEDDVAMREHDALGVPRRAGRIDDRRKVIGLHQGKDNARIRQPGKRLDRKLQAGRVPELRPQLAGDEDGGAPCVIEDVLNLSLGELGHDGDDHRPQGGDGEVGDAPLRHVLREDGDAVSGTDAVPAQERCGAPHPRAELAIGERRRTEHAQRGPAGKGARTAREHSRKRET